jgi:polar amino acid transport system substrate-binding protein
MTAKLTRLLLIPAIGALCGLMQPHTAAAASAAMDPALHAMLPADIQKSGVLAIATDAHYPPCESFADDNKTMVGYEPDMWNAIGAKLGVKIKPISTDFDGLIPGVQSGRYPMAMECISDSAVREKQVTFIDNSYGTTAVYTLATNTTVSADATSLCGLKSAAQAGTDFNDTLSAITARCKKQGKPGVTVSEFPSADAVLLALYAGRVDFVLSDAAAAGDIQKHAPKPVKIFTNDLMPKLYTGMVVLPTNTQLAEATLAGLRAIIADGTYDALMEKWDLKLLELHNPQINQATVDPLPVVTP